MAISSLRDFFILLMASVIRSMASCIGTLVGELGVVGDSVALISDMCD